MADVALNLNVPFRPITWPQDTLAIPNGQGRMPEVDVLNAQKIRREYFTYSGSMGNFTDGVTQTLNINTQKDGDFWISSITAIGVEVQAGINTFVELNADVRVVDTLTQYSIYTPFIPFSFIDRGIPQNTGGGLMPSYFITNIIEPYCILRGGNISISITPHGFGGAPYTAYFAFNGWKEYANAAS